jgi:hypothetical protein
MMRRSECITAVMVFACAGEEGAGAAESTKADKVMMDTKARRCRPEI